MAASLPAALIGIYVLGRDAAAGLATGAAAPWQIHALTGLGVDPADAGVVASTARGVAFLAPLLAVALLVSRGWAELFARARGRPLDPGWAVSAWLFVLLAPATLPLPLLVLALSFGLVFGSHVFGGTGRYLVNPALLGIVFLAVAYPPFVATTAWLPGAALPTTWTSVAAAGAEAAIASGTTWRALFLGDEIGAIGTGSAAACLLGAALLCWRDRAATPIVAGGIVSVAAAALLGGGIPWHWHPVVGNFAFALAFVATDPTTQPRTRAACWAFGGLLGGLTIVLRTANPAHPEGTWFAFFLAALCVPLLDSLAVAARNWRSAPAARHE